MDFKTLLRKHQALLAENQALKEENLSLKARLDLADPPESRSSQERVQQDASRVEPSFHLKDRANPAEKIRLFMSLFKGRVDLYAKRWESREDRSGYAPVCLNEWKPGFCGKPEVKCAFCDHRSYAALDERVIEAHLRGNLVAGIYPLRQDEKCHFLAMDFDKDGWQQDVSTLRDVCTAFAVPVAIERSRSGHGAHAWFFFYDPVAASLARKFGSALLTRAMSERHQIKFKSYDRLFPNQDTMPKGGFGNLIALPLQKAARKNGNSVFIDERFHPYEDQWGFLAQIRRLSEDEIGALISKLCHGSELGELKQDDEEATKPWETRRSKLSRHEFPNVMQVVKANMLYLGKSGISQRALNALKRLAAFQNPEFYRAQAMRTSTYGKPRIISCAEETPEYLCLPRGCEADLATLLVEAGVEGEWSDKTHSGKHVEVAFTGVLREDQELAAEAMLKHDCGVLAAATAFGKTVIAARLIAARKTNTLILTHRQQLLSQWMAKLAQFLEIDEELPVAATKRGRKPRQSLIGQIGAGRVNPGGIIDVAIMQSLASGGEVKEFIRDYGMVIVDECHHVPAFSFEQILKKVHAKYIYGLTATPARRDGHHPIIFMHCGPVRYRADARKEAEKRPFEHYVIPRFTGFRAPFDREEKDMSIQEFYSGIASDELRNQQITDDVIRAHENGRNALILTERTAHVELLAGKLREKILEVITLTGGRGGKETRNILAKIAATPVSKQLTLVATGRYIGEGFDEPRLDTLFLAMPISWRGTLQQYAGRLHRLFENKKEVQIYDYVDIRVGTLEKMYWKRLAGYSAIGYRAKAESIPDEPADIIFDNTNFLPVYHHDMMNAAREAVIVSPFVTRRRVLQMLPNLEAALAKRVSVVVITRPTNAYKDKDRPALEETLASLQDAGVRLLFKANIHQKFAVIDRKIVWYGSINLLSYGSVQESIMRLESPNIAQELIKTLENPSAPDR
ncbi:MAG: DEAD/DEAH box helicase family protein [Deltaproteobacteria bacterium]|nr:DEAD/DEAH box helicase family protein [Deltaproteobacteria bacterium]